MAVKGQPDNGRYGPAWLIQAARIARRFHLDGASKTDIAAETGLSRFKVARILEEAHELGLVKVTIAMPSRIDAELSEQVRDRFGLRRVVVVESAEDSPSTVRGHLAEVAAQLLTELVTDRDVLGLSCSRSVAATALALDQLAPCQVVQLSGTLAGPDQENGSVESVRRMARVSGGPAFPIYSPMVLPDPTTVEALTGQSGIREAVAKWPDVTVALVAIGAWHAGLSTVWAAVDADTRKEVAAAGGVGEIAARVFDTAGEPSLTSLDERVLGISLEGLRAVPDVIGLAFDARRARAVAAALTGRLIDTLVCDAALAHGVLDGVPDRQLPGREVPA